MATTFLSPAVQTKKGCRNRFCVCFWLNVCGIPTAPPAPPHLFPVCLATMRLLPPQPTQRLVTALLLFVRYADYAQSKSVFWWVWRELVGGKKTRSAQDVRHGDTLQMLLGPRSNLQCAVLRTLLGWRRKMENNNR